MKTNRDKISLTSHLKQTSYYLRSNTFYFDLKPTILVFPLANGNFAQALTLFNGLAFSNKPQKFIFVEVF
jgi:hypothetical protein